MIDYPPPVIGFSAFRGTGKTTLLKKLLPILKEKGLRIGVVKHAHHQFDIDYKKKDSYELRKAGADQMLVASRRRMALITDFGENHEEPTPEEVLDALDPDMLDLILVEGFKRERFSKIELHRPSQGRPLIYLSDPSIVAIATDSALPNTPGRPPVLDLNHPQEVATFILSQIRLQTENRLYANKHQSHSTQL